ncbi:phage terminase large subunit [Nesterenkonia lacusekhoensis]|uniref:Phage terminase large subunit-like protein n=1 Tax=Nesterenkonia lacusekhoensis TaxID=150832 RepID=A0ABS4T540_9MICC|nr:phage terminase large subunit [Nesterenkonia lacusekhoensis]MBP2319574.1 putative phage terminase large subunit-like protein [Nesterenkonia lacusekhoensis]
MTSATDLWELVAQRFDPPTKRWDSPADMADELDPKHRRAPVIDYINDRLVDLYNRPDSRMILSVPPQSGKSQLAARRFALWALTQNPDTRIAIASYEMGVARRWGRTIRDDIRQNADKLGMLKVRDDVSSQSEWMVTGYQGGVYSVGVGGALTGRPVDLLIIDDPVKDAEQAASKTYQERLWDWWNTTAQTRLSPGAPVVVIQTRWDQRDLAGRLLAENGDEWEFTNIPAKADHRPEKGETDPLGREPGEYLRIPSGRNRAQWEQRERNTSPRTWAALYQGRPSPDEGGVLPKTDDWHRYTHPMWTERGDGVRHLPGVGARDDHELIQSWDLTFKDAKDSDYVVGQVWLRIGSTVYLIDQVRERMNFTTTIDAIKRMHARYPQAYGILVEDKANGPAVISMLRSEVPGIIPVEPQGSKYARANAIAPYVMSGNVVIPETSLLPGAGDLLEEAMNFPNAAHDDTVDALSQAVKALLQDRIDGGIGQIIEPDEYEDDALIAGAW